MSLSIQTANRIREVFLDGHWVAKTNYKDALKDINLADATKSIGQHNSIALIVYHVNYYLEGLNQAFQDGALTIKDKFSFEMPPLTSNSEWKNLADRIIENANTFAILIEGLNDEQLNAQFVRAEYGTNLRNIEAVIEHAYYHLGQIVILKKLNYGHKE